MKYEVAQRWIKALRSGKYKQGSKALKYHDKGVTRHCCLGVLCELYQQEKKSKQKKLLTVKKIDPQQDSLFLNLSAKGHAYRFGDTATDLPRSVAKWAGMSSCDGEYIKSHKRVFNLAALNDKGATFKEIADVIDRKREEL